MESKMIKAGLTGIALVVALASTGCRTPLVDMHSKDGTPYQGLAPYALSGGEAHHGVDKDSPAYNSKALTLIAYKF